MSLEMLVVMKDYPGVIINTRDDREQTLYWLIKQLQEFYRQQGYSFHNKGFQKLSLRGKQLEGYKCGLFPLPAETARASRRVSDASRIRNEMPPSSGYYGNVIIKVGSREQSFRVAGDCEAPSAFGTVLRNYYMIYFNKNHFTDASNFAEYLTAQPDPRALS